MASAPVSAIGRIMQLAIEGTEGTDTAATKKFRSIMFDIRPRIESEAVRPQGQYVNSGYPIGYDYSEGPISGRATYNELAYLVASYFSYSAPAQIAATDAYSQAFGLSVEAADTHKTMTVETGYATPTGSARQAVGVVVNELSLECSRANGMQVGGNVLGRLFTKGVTMSSGATALPFAPVLGKHLSIYLDATWAGLGGTKLEDTVTASLNFGARYEPWWPMNAAQASFSAKVPGAPAITATLRMAANSVGYAYLDAIRAGEIVFLRVEAEGDDIEAGNLYTATFDLAMQYTGGAPESAEGNALVLEAPLGLVVDPTSGNALAGNLIHTLTSL